MIPMVSAMLFAAVLDLFLGVMMVMWLAYKKLIGEELDEWIE